MPGMKDDYEYDAEGDVKMAIPQPIFEVTRAPSLKVWSQSAITTFLRERKQCEGKVIEQCRVTGEVQAAVTRSIRSTLEPRVLEHVAHYLLKQDAASVSDDMLVAEMKRKVGTMLIEDNGLASMLGRGVAIDEQSRQRMKLRCEG
ncbi:hypothetical protein PF010_g1785 [Phytophthora fragariae]|uniref:Uncharacterized protein n=1 Tax=Phytophthora fragariae TaxID=53985 RepID=A0A6G0LZ23_9STRA|nr:hypothetical protein PF010_g1785 [Phytophthora fragariae]